MHDIPFDFMVGIGSLVYVLNNFVANITGKQWSSALKQLIAWIFSVIVVVVSAHTAWAASYAVGTVPLSKLNLASLVFLGLLPGSLFGVVYHVGQRLDQNGSGNVPDLPVPEPAHAKPVTGTGTHTAPRTRKAA